MGFMALVIPSPDILIPSFEITAAIAHPEGIRTCPSSFKSVRPSYTQKASLPEGEFSPFTGMNAFAHLQEVYTKNCILSRTNLVYLYFLQDLQEKISKKG